MEHDAGLRSGEQEVSAAGRAARSRMIAIDDIKTSQVISARKIGLPRSAYLIVSHSEPETRCGPYSRLIRLDREERWPAAMKVAIWVMLEIEDAVCIALIVGLRLAGFEVRIDSELPVLHCASPKSFPTAPKIGRQVIGDKFSPGGDPKSVVSFGEARPQHPGPEHPWPKFLST